MFDLAIKSTRIITPGGVCNGMVIIENGIITDIANSSGTSDSRIIDVQDKIVMPGIIDPHVHINEPGRTEWEGFYSATKAALAGGITALVDMPLNSSPVTTTAKAFDEKFLAAKDQLHTNCGFWGGVIPGNEHDIEPLIQKGVLGFKAFLTHSGINEFPNVTENDLMKVMPLIAKYNLPLLVHCELTTNLTTTQTHTPNNNRSYKNYLASRPRQWEDDAIALMIRLCEEYNCRVHIVHLSSSDSIGQIAAAKQKGLPITAETGQHYLYFNAEEIKDGHTEFKCAPPIREKENNDKLWQGLNSGTIDFVATDHSPCVPGLKELESGDFMKAWGGIASVQFALPVLWSVAREKGCSLNDISKWLCENPAKLAGLAAKKGRIQQGFDADILVWDDKKEFTVSEDLILHKHKITPYLNEKLYGVVEQTYLSGEKVFDKGKFLHLNKGKIILAN